VASGPFTGIDQVQLAMPVGGEDTARWFYCSVLRMTEVPKPPELAKRGGCWFLSRAVQLHLGVEPDFRAARKAHPALRGSDSGAFVARLRAAGVEVKTDDPIPAVPSLPRL
jgi:hypothetical protein